MVWICSQHEPLLTKSSLEGLVIPARFVGHAAPPQVFGEAHSLGFAEEIFHRAGVSPFAVSRSTEAPGYDGPHGATTETVPFSNHQTCISLPSQTKSGGSVQVIKTMIWS